MNSSRFRNISLQLGILATFVLFVCKADLPTCQPDDFHWVYTECDSEGSRWRVQVPEPGKCEGGAPKPPVRGVQCDLVCNVGEYLDVQNDQNCHKCPKGTYSLGGGYLFEDWTELPPGFTIDYESDIQNKTVCPGGWRPVDGVMMAEGSRWCSSTLRYKTTLVRGGSVKFEYRYNFDDSRAIFLFKANWEKNRETSSLRLPSNTDDDEDWSFKEVELEEGENVLEWEVFTMGSDSANEFRFSKPIIIKSIQVTGVAFTQSCTPCKAGTFSNQAGAEQCEECPKNTFSSKGASSCQNCDGTTQFSYPGASQCQQRQPCTKHDYVEYMKPCENNQTRTEYKWNSGRTCREDLPDSVQLPQASPPTACPPCNPGMQMGSEGTCVFCEEGQFSDGSGSCAQCPASTEPVYSLEVDFWSHLPLEANLTANCIPRSQCSNDNGWLRRSDYLETNLNQPSGVFLLFTISIEGFRGQVPSPVGKQSGVFGELSFTFEMECRAECMLYLIERGQSEEMNFVASFNGTQKKQSFTMQVRSAGARDFMWVFSTFQQGDAVTDVARIFNVKITNTLDTGAVGCRDCPRGATANAQCVPCPKNHYIDPSSKQCEACPQDSVLPSSSSAWGVESCHHCGQGLHRSKSGDACVTACQFTDPVTGQQFDFSKLPHHVEVNGPKQFFQSGRPYRTLFNVSLCGGNDEEPAMATCLQNLTMPREDVEIRRRKHFRRRNGPTVVSAAICRSNVVPSDLGPLSISVSSIGDELIEITTNLSKIEPYISQEEWFPEKDESLQMVDDVHFIYSLNEVTSVCKSDRRSIITMRCVLSSDDDGHLLMPPACPQGTCDGCNFHFMWLTPRACPKCEDDLYTEIPLECKGGEQEVRLIAPKFCPEKPPLPKQKCRILPFWLEVTIASMCVLAVCLCIIVVYCWNRNKNLEYKYMKLVAPREGKDGVELPAAETCALDDDDDDDEEGSTDFESVQFKESKGVKFFSKLKNMAGSKKDDGFSKMSMSDLQPLT